MTHRHEVTRKPVRYDIPGTADVVIRRHVQYSSAPERALDVYYPPARTRGRTDPAVIIASGLSDFGAQRLLGCRINEMESFISWGRLLAASGLVAITHTTSENPADDLRALLHHVASAGIALGVDADHLGLFAVSSHVPNALALLMSNPAQLRCAALCYGFMLDLDGSTGVAEAQKVWRFANPETGESIDALPADVPLLIVRAGRDIVSEVNPSIDSFVAHALRRNLPLRLVNHHTAPHAFDLDDESEASKEVVREILAFLYRTLRVGECPRG